MVDWLRENWIWVAGVVVFFWLHAKMHGSHGAHSHGGGGGQGGCCGPSTAGESHDHAARDDPETEDAEHRMRS